MGTRRWAHRPAADAWRAARRMMLTLSACRTDDERTHALAVAFDALFRATKAGAR